MSDTNSAICCPEFDPAPWNKKTIVWKDKPFLFRTVPQFLHMPLPGVYGKAITEMYESADYEGIIPGQKDSLLLAYDPSPWKSELYLSITAEKPGLQIRKISGTFMTQVFDGPYNGIPSYIREMDVWLAENGKQAKKYFFYYTTCPKCAKKYGHNYIVAFAEVG